LKGLGCGVGGAEGIGEARLDKGPDGIQFLPWGKEGLFNFVEFCCELVHKVLEVGDVGYQANGYSKVSVVFLTLEGRDDFMLDAELVAFNAWCSFGHGKAGTFVGSELER
jgi:hypothetical protein